MSKLRILFACIAAFCLITACSRSTPLPDIPQAIPTEGHPVSLDAMLEGLEQLTSVEAFSGWRNSASSGESQALDWLETELDSYSYLESIGMELERQTFSVFMGTEIYSSDLLVDIDGQQYELPADGLRGPRDDLAAATYFDTDGNLTDQNADPVSVHGSAYLIDTTSQLSALSPGQLRGQIAVVDYALIDRSIMETAEAVENLLPILEADPEGIVLVTAFSNQIGESHGGFIGDLSAFNYAGRAFPPTIYTRLEDAQSIGISNWEDLTAIDSIQIDLDVDVITPAQSGNLIVHIPGADSSQAILLGAHIDSPNGPGAMDDGSGSIIMLEVARALNQTQTQPPTDTYLIWFGSEEIGLYGSTYFASTHQDLLDRSAGMLQIDCLSAPLDGIQPQLTLVSYPTPPAYASQTPWAEWISRLGQDVGLPLDSYSTPYIYSDNNTLQGYAVPNVDLIYEDEAAMEAAGGFHYAAHVHDPYDTVDLIRDNVDGVLEAMAQVAYEVVVNGEVNTGQFHQEPAPSGRVVFVGTHTEAAHLSPSAWIDFGQELGQYGYDVDLIPYGQSFTASDLEGAALVVALPVLDYEPSMIGEVGGDSWNPDEIAILEAYVQDGGFLMIANSYHRLKFADLALDDNEDRLEANSLATVFGITYWDGSIPGGSIRVEEGHALTSGITALQMAENNGVPFTIAHGEVLAWAGGEPLVALVDHGQGQVLVLGDAALLTTGWGGPINQPFWQALAEYLGS